MCMMPLQKNAEASLIAYRAVLCFGKPITSASATPGVAAIYRMFWCQNLPQNACTPHAGDALVGIQTDVTEPKWDESVRGEMYEL